MARTEAEKYRLHRYQTEDGHWYTERQLIHDPAYCDICDSEDVEQPSELVTVSGWYGGVKILWGSWTGANRPNVVEVLCRKHNAEHYEALMNAPRHPAEIDGWTEQAYYCPAHESEHYDFGSY